MSIKFTLIFCLFFVLPTCACEDLIWNAYEKLGVFMQTGSCEGASFRYISKDDLVESLDIVREYHKGRRIKMLRTDFSHTDLADLDFSDIDLCGSSFTLNVLNNVSFAGACLVGAQMWRSQFYDVDFSGADLTDVSMHNSIFKAVNFSNAVLSRMDLRFAKIVDKLIFDGAVLNKVQLDMYNFAILNYIKNSRGVILKR